MVAAMVKKAFEDLDNMSALDNATPRLDKFALKVFN